MHELPVVTTVLESVLSRARSENASRVVSVQLVIGGLHDLIPEWVQKYFAYASRGTIAEGASVNIITVPVICQCRKCGENFLFHTERELPCRCPCCAAGEFTVATGREFELRGIEIIHE
jgi:hydrogenase nickel incorporation protein HypA/HybF